MKSRIALGFLLVAALSSPAWALHEVYSPDVEKGEAEVEYRGDRFGDEGGILNNAQEHEVELGYSFTDDVRIELSVEGGRQTERPFFVNAYGAKAIYQTTAQEDGAWLSSGILAGYEHTPRDETADEGKLALLLEREQDDLDVIVNLTAEHGLGEGTESGFELGSVVQGIYKITEPVGVGLEWSADWGNTNNPLDNQQTHYVGPLLAGEFEISEHSDIEYLIGYYWGLNEDAADNAARFQLGYEFEF